MSFMRPEALATLTRWREALAGSALALLGIWIMARQGGFYFGAGALMSLLGLGLMFTGLRHALFRTDQSAPGIVEVVEGRITYLGPLLGGTVALDDVRAITYRLTKGGEAFWRFDSNDAQPLIIPAGAQGVEKLLDACTVLPRLDPGRMVRAVQMRTAGSLAVWQHPARDALT